VTTNDFQDYVHYSREIAELRREVLEIVRLETESPAAIDANRLMQRLHEAFSAQLYPPSSVIPRTPAVLTPSTTNDGTRSTGRSSQGQWRVSLEQSPSVTATQQVNSALDITSTMLLSDNLATPSPWLASNNRPPASPVINTHLSSTENDLQLHLASSPVPFKLVNDNHFDLDQFIWEIEGDTASKFNSQD
jgi:hypothetical protein